MYKTYTVIELANKPAIRLTGKWLIKDGFDIGDKIELFKDSGILVLIKINNDETAQKEKQRKILSLERQLKKLK